MQWTRSSHGLIAGVCRGISERLGLDTSVVRMLWLVSILCFGTGLAAYFVLAIALPREDKLHKAMNRRVLGVCSRISRRTGIEVGLVRAVALGLAVVSLGTMILLYFIVWIAFAVAADEDRRLSAPVR